MKYTSAEQLVRKGRVHLLTKNPFFGALALRLNLAEDPTLEKAMATDGATLRFNPLKVSQIDIEQLKALEALHVMRCVAGHPYRRGSRKEDLWDRAGEYATTPLLLDSGFVLPPGALYDARFRDHSAEQVYTLLEQEQQQGNQPQDAGAGASQVRDAPAYKSDGKPGDKPPQGQAESSQKAQGERDWQLAAMQAAMAGKRQGSLGAGAEALINDIQHPTLDWRILLRRFVTQAAKNDYRWFPANRRYLSAGLYLPSLRSEQLGEIVVAIDTSGSIGQTLLDKFAAEVNTITQDSRPARVHVVYCDAMVQHVDTFERDDAITLARHGGGGTSFAPVFEYVEEQGLSPAALIYLTDMLGGHTDTEPSYPVLWAASGPYPARFEPPFGEVVTIES